MTEQVDSEKVVRVYAMHLTGRCRSGADSAGTLVHALPAVDPQPGCWTTMSSVALCGRTYGRRSAGWSGYLDRQVTCPRCLRKMAQMGDVTVIQPDAQP
jgi:hypothetical protein